MKRASILFFLFLSIPLLANEDPLKRAAFVGLRWKAAPAPEQGIEIVSVQPGSAAESIGLQKGDRVTSMNKRPISSAAQFEVLYSSLRAGDVLEMEVVRQGQTFQKSITLPPLPKEKWEGIDTQYGAVQSEKGDWLRSIVTRPMNRQGRMPGIFVVGWLSCDSVEFPLGPRKGVSKLLHELITRSGFAIMRIDKPGVGDSGGPPCRSCDFETELAGYRAALAAFKKYDFVDPQKIILLGISNGGGFAPLVGDAAGYIVSGGWSKTWFEHMLEIERQRLDLLGHKPGEITDMLKAFEEFYTHYLIEKKTPGEIARQYPHLSDLWYDEPEHQYGRPARFYHQLQDLNLAAAWQMVSVPVLAIYGEYDWIMSRSDHEWIVAIVNRNNEQPPPTPLPHKEGEPLARLVTIPKMDHGFTIQENMRGSFENFGGGKFDENLVTMIMDWLQKTVR